MLSLFLVTLCLAATGAYAKPMVRAGGGLEVFLSTPADKVASVSELRVIVTIKNVGDEGLKIVKLGTVLDTQNHTRSFIVTKDGREVPFTGIEMTEILVPAGYLSENDLVVIPAGENVTAEHNVSAVYDFSATGPGTFIFNLTSSFQVTGLNDIVETISDTARVDIDNSPSVSITVTDDLSKHEPNLEKRMVVDCPDARHQWSIFLSFLDAKTLASTAISYIEEHKSDSIYQNFFESNSPERVISNFRTIANQEWTSWTMSCSDKYKRCKSSNVAYSGDDSVIYYCDPFYKIISLNAICRETVTYIPQGAVTLRELSIVLKQTTGSGSSCTNARNMPKGDKINSAWAHACFAAAVYQKVKCNF